MVVQQPDADEECPPVIAVDANGADQGPAAVAEGARRSGTGTLVFGPEAELGEGIQVVAPEAIEAGAEPVRAVRERSEASIVQAAKAVADGRADALVSAGSTGPTLAAATLSIKRTAASTGPLSPCSVPIPGKPVLFLDCGANVEVRPEHLVQFAYMGAGFMEAVHGAESPSVGLLSVGEEQGKARRTSSRQAGGWRRATSTSWATSRLRPAGAGADVIVSDGFTGNVALKVLEHLAGRPRRDPRAHPLGLVFISAAC